MKKILIGLVLIIIAVSGAWFFKYLNDVDESEILKFTIPEITNENSKNLNIKEIEKGSDRSSQNIDQNSSINKDAKQENSNLDGPLKNVPKNQQPSKTAEFQNKNEIENEIINRYNKIFSSLKDQFQTKLNELLTQAKKEYENTLNSKNPLSKVTLGVKYLKLGKDLESQCDAVFNQTLGEMEKELKENNLPLDAAENIQKQYIEEKNKRRDLIMQKALK